MTPDTFVALVLFVAAACILAWGIRVELATDRGYLDHQRSPDDPDPADAAVEQLREDMADPAFVERMVFDTRNADRREHANRLSAQTNGRTTAHCDRHGRLGCGRCPS